MIPELQQLIMTYHVHLKWSELMSYEDALNSTYSICYIYETKYPCYIGKVLCDSQSDKQVRLATMRVEGEVDESTYENILDDVIRIIIHMIYEKHGLLEPLEFDLWNDYIICSENDIPFGVGRVIRANKGKYQIHNKTALE